jgi:hypothetical protein
MTMIEEYYDLCGSCTFGTACMNRGTRERPKLYCEQFDVESKETPAWEPSDVVADPSPTDAGESRGLCCNCENRNHCTITKPEGDVWHCEEYA